jgi:hypothetical protein
VRFFEAFKIFAKCDISFRIDHFRRFLELKLASCDFSDEGQPCLFVLFAVLANPLCLAELSIVDVDVVFAAMFMDSDAIFNSPRIC